MTLKPGVRVAGARPETVLAMLIADGLIPAMVVTSITEGKHSSTSLHYSGAAFDIRTRDLADVPGVCVRLRTALGQDYDVVEERDHIHVEFQPKSGLQIAPG